MKRSVFQIALFLGLQLSLAASAQNKKVTLHVPNFVRPLVEKWVTEYQKTNTGIDFQFISGKIQDNDNSITFTTHGDDVVFARYAVLPVTTNHSKAIQLLGSHRLNAKKLKNLFFIQDEIDDEQEVSKKEQLHIISGNSKQSASRLLASHFKQETVNYKGKKISGDDSFLNQAISRDPLGVTVNSLSNIFDLKSRQLREGLSLLPLELDKHGRQVLSEGKLDDIIKLLEEEHYQEIPIGNVGISYHHNSETLTHFVQWILNEGTKYVHEYGLLGLPQKELIVQQHRLKQKDLALK